MQVVWLRNEGIVPPDNKLFGGTVPLNNLFPSYNSPYRQEDNCTKVYQILDFKLSLLKCISTQKGDIKDEMKEMPN